MTYTPIQNLEANREKSINNPMITKLKNATIIICLWQKSTLSEDFCWSFEHESKNKNLWYLSHIFLGYKKSLKKSMLCEKSNAMKKSMTLEPLFKEMIPLIKLSSEDVIVVKLTSQRWSHQKVIICLKNKIPLRNNFDPMRNNTCYVALEHEALK